jgi:NAD(P)H-dependent flavin oxidoreductase YrpB (nitropropane dioxygenase family)
MAINNIPLINLNGLKFNFIQGGMGVGISLSGLASAVSNEGGLGVIASVGIGSLKNLREENTYLGSYETINSQALRDEITQARRKTNGPIGVNIMHVLQNYSSLIKTAIDEKVEVIISGAGIPRDLPGYLSSNSKTKLIPIVSSRRVAEMIVTSWIRKYHYLPDAIIVEGPKSGGHQGYSFEELNNPEFVSNGLERRLSDVLDFLKSDEITAKIPVIVAGGVFYGGDIRKFNCLGATGVQMATRFVTTDECDADILFKQEYLNCTNEKDIVVIKSPVGLPGRAISNEFLEEVKAGKRFPISCDYGCLKTCNPCESPYCIANALGSAARGKLMDGFAFAGTNAWRCKDIVPVKQVVSKLDKEYNDNTRTF